MQIKIRRSKLAAPPPLIYHHLFKRFYRVYQDSHHLYSPLHKAADRYGRDTALTLLIAAGAKVNAVDRHGQTPLVRAILEGRPQYVMPLINAGADKDIKV